VKLTRLYSNKPNIFAAIEFNEGLSIVLAEIRIPANQLLDTHNLGKTTVGELIDFCLLKGKSRTFFLFKHESRFSDFTFYLEMRLDDGRYVTVARPVVPGSKVDFLISAGSVLNASETDEDWAQTGLAFGRAKAYLNSLLGFAILKPWNYRMLVGYLVRSQTDYVDVFQLGKFSGKHVNWKPFVAHILGVDGRAVSALYTKREELLESAVHLSAVVQEWGSEAADPSALDGLISVKRAELENRAAAAETFNFGQADSGVSEELVGRIEAEVVVLNDERYRLTQLLARIEDSLSGQAVLFRTEDAERLFSEAGVELGAQVKRDYAQLLAFNRAITEERHEALRGQADVVQGELEEINTKLVSLNIERAHALQYLRETDALAKYKELTKEVSRLEVSLSSLEGQRAAATRLTDLRQERRLLREQYGHLETQVEQLITEASGTPDSRFGLLRKYFNEIISEVLGQSAILVIRMNSEGGLDYSAEFIGDTGAETGGAHGTSYKKLLCIAFDLALLRAYIDVPFPRFVYHDGALEQLEMRKREKLLGVMRDYSSYGLQSIISTLDGDLPQAKKGAPPFVSEADVVVRLHDEGVDGRLFKMDPW